MNKEFLWGFNLKEIDNMRLYLLQRATFKKDMIKATKLSELVSYDYMGSAEFEFGALPKSKVRIIDNSDNYKLITIPELATPNGVPFNLYCAEDRIDEIVEEIKKYIENLNDIGDLHIPNLITDIINEYEDRIYYIEFVGFNTFGTDDQHIIQVDENVDVPEFINVRNVIDPSTGLIVPDIEITLV